MGSFSLGGERRKIKRHEFLVFNQELATLLKAGMPLVQSLDILRSRLSNPVFKSVLDDVHEKVRGGIALSDAFAAHGDLFPPIYTASLMAGERAGNLDAVLRRFVSYSKTIDTVRSKTISAMIYPVILVALAVAAGRHHRRSRWCRRLRSSTAASTRSCRCRRGSSWRSRTSSAPSSF